MSVASFYPGKNLGALGEAGAAITNNVDLKRDMDTLRDHGQAKKYCHSMVGWNGRMDGIQAAALSIKLQHLATWNQKRREHAEHYTRLLRELDELILPLPAPERAHVYHLYAVRVSRRDELMRHLAQKGIGCGIHYPIPVHLQEAYSSLGLQRGTFPIAERCADEFVSLPMFPELQPTQVEYVANEVASWVQSAVAQA